MCTPSRLGHSVVTVTAALLGLAALGLMGCDRGAPYGACSRDLPCGADAPLCLSSTTATRRTVQFCSKRCNTPATSSTECPGNGACVRLNGGDPVCMGRCASDAECDFDGALCATLPDSMGQRVCTARP